MEPGSCRARSGFSGNEGFNDIIQTEGGFRRLGSEPRQVQPPAGPLANYLPCSSRQQSTTWTAPSPAFETAIEFAVLFVTRVPPIATVSFGFTRCRLGGIDPPQFTARDFSRPVRSAEGRPSESAVACFPG